MRLRCHLACNSPDIHLSNKCFEQNRESWNAKWSEHVYRKNAFTLYHRTCRNFSGKKKVKKSLIHVIKSCWVECRRSFTRLHAPATLSLENKPVTHLIESWMGSKVVPDHLEMFWTIQRKLERQVIKARLQKKKKCLHLVPQDLQKFFRKKTQESLSMPWNHVG